MLWPDSRLWRYSWETHLSGAALNSYAGDSLGSIPNARAAAWPLAHGAVAIGNHILSGPLDEPFSPSNFQLTGPGQPAKTIGVFGVLDSSNER